MEKEFVPYELALRLKALGFDEPCFGLYAPPSKTVFLHHYGLLRAKEQILAPLYQQAFRWFREKYDLGHMINGIGHESFIMNIAGVLHIFNAFEFNTYEEAELACLEKLLEIVESKKE
jgi:hypothetical protein